MPDWVMWVALGVVAAVLLALLINFIIKLYRMKPEEREELLVDMLVGLVTLAETLYVEKGMGKEKLAEVEKLFNEKAPWFYKVMLKLCKSTNLDELIEKALKKAKDTWNKQA